MKYLVLDAMGVIYSVGDDVKDLLCPFVEEKGGVGDVSRIEGLYLSASLGSMSASEFWKAVSLSPEVEDEYLQRLKLSDGLINFLEKVKSQDYEVWCLSNDLSEWSRKLRARFGLDNYFRGFIVSGDVGIRKPTSAMFDYLLQRLDTKPSEVTFVDDQLRNIDSAAALGFHTVLFAPSGGVLSKKHQIVMTFSELLFLLTQ
ncbi:MAG: HAD-IA family hydrolase [Chloroflexota bacterium]